MKVDNIEKLLQLQLMTQLLKSSSSNGDSSDSFQTIMQSLLASMSGSGSDMPDPASGDSINLNSLGDVDDGSDIGIKTNVSSGNMSIDEAVNNASKKYGVDKNLIMSVIKQESSFNPNARSGAGAMGLMQLMPGTARSLGVNDAYNVQQNVDGGTKYLSELLQTFGNNKEMALAAYNAGPNAVKSRGMQNKDQVYKMPAETRDYVSKIMKYYNNSKNV